MAIGRHSVLSGKSCSLTEAARERGLGEATITGV